MNKRTNIIICIILFGTIFLLNSNVGIAQPDILEGCAVQVTNISEPADDTQFLYRVVDSKSNINETKLSDPGFKTVTFLHPPSVTMVLSLEDIPDGWFLNELTCGNEIGLTFEVVNDIVMIDCPNLGFMSCTYINKFGPLSSKEVPTLSFWVLLTFAGILGIMCLVVLKKRKITI